MSNTHTKIVAIGDQHFRVDNIEDATMFITKIKTLCEKESPELIILLGDLLHTHERLHTTPLNKAYELIDTLRQIAPVIVIVGNHDMCLGENTPILMWNGSIKPSQDIRTGDELVGDDGTKRIVQETFSGINELFKIYQDRAQDYIVSGNHTLSLYNSSTLEIEDIPLIDFQNTSPRERVIYQGVKCSMIHWESQPIPLDPYIYGSWMCDRNITERKYPVSSIVSVKEKFNKVAVDSRYIVNSEQNRLQFLAGFFDMVNISSSDNKSMRSSIFITKFYIEYHYTQLTCVVTTYLSTVAHSLGFRFQDHSTKAAVVIIGDISRIPFKTSQIRNTENALVDISTMSQIRCRKQGIGKYYGWRVDKNGRFLLGDHTVTHNCNNQVYLSDNHWLNGLKDWDRVTVVDKVTYCTTKSGDTLCFTPYVYPGRFEEALNEDGNDTWKQSRIIFAHQEFAGCKMGAITSVEGDNWSEEYPHVISGHIHSRQQPQKNVYYPGSAMQHAFGESEKNIIPIITIGEDIKGYDLREVDLELPRKKIVYLGVEDIDNYKPPEKSKDKVKVTVTGNHEEFKALKKTQKYKELVQEGVKVVFKPRVIKTDSDTQVDESMTDFHDILTTIVNNQRDPYLVQAYEKIVHDKDISESDVMFI